jgi:hypothetical protein
MSLVLLMMMEPDIKGINTLSVMVRLLMVSAVSNLLFFVVASPMKTL